MKHFDHLNYNPLKHTIAGLVCGSVCALFSMTMLEARPAPQGAAATAPTEVRGGSISFEVGTNVGISVHGESKALQGKVRVREGAAGLRLEQIEAVVPVQSLNTGMKLRDGHMRKYIFETPEGQTPDLRFTAEQAECKPAGGNGQSTCVASGVLVIRGTSRPFVMDLAVTRDNEQFRVKGDGTVLLSAYGIERPSQLGVKTDDKVTLHLELSGRSATAPAATLSSSNRR